MRDVVLVHMCILESSVTVHGSLMDGRESMTRIQESVVAARKSRHRMHRDLPEHDVVVHLRMIRVLHKQLDAVVHYLQIACNRSVMRALAPHVLVVGVAVVIDRKERMRNLLLVKIQYVKSGSYPALTSHRRRLATAFAAVDCMEILESAYVRTEDGLRRFNVGSTTPRASRDAKRNKVMRESNDTRAQTDTHTCASTVTSFASTPPRTHTKRPKVPLDEQEMHRRTNLLVKVPHFIMSLLHALIVM